MCGLQVPQSESGSSDHDNDDTSYSDADDDTEDSGGSAPKRRSKSSLERKDGEALNLLTALLQQAADANQGRTP